MVKRRFKQYTLLKHKKRLQSIDFAFTKQPKDGTFFFSAPNWITNILFKDLPVSFVGCSYYQEFKHERVDYTLIKQGGSILPRTWVGLLENLFKRPIGLSNLFPQTTLIRVLFLLQVRFLTLINANVL